MNNFLNLLEIQEWGAAKYYKKKKNRNLRENEFKMMRSMVKKNSFLLGPRATCERKRRAGSDRENEKVGLVWGWWEETKGKGGAEGGWERQGRWIWCLNEKEWLSYRPRR